MDGGKDTKDELALQAKAIEEAAHLHAKACRRKPAATGETPMSSFSFLPLHLHLLQDHMLGLLQGLRKSSSLRKLLCRQGP